MRKSEITLTALAGLALVLNLINIVASNILAALSFSLLALFYLYFSFALFNSITLKRIFKKDSYTQISKKRLIGAALFGVTISFTIIGLLFKLLFLPGGSFLVLVGTTGLISALIISSVKFQKSKSSFHQGIFKRASIYGVIGLIAISLPSNFLLEVKNRDYPEYIEAVKNARAQPDNQDLWDKVHDERDKMNGVK